MKITYPTQLVSMNLDQGNLIDLEPPRKGVKIEVQSGNLWVTQKGDGADHVLGPGESHSFTGCALVVVQALLSSAFRLTAMS